MQERETKDQVRSKMYQYIKSLALKRVQKAPEFCQAQIKTFLTRMPATMSIGGHLMRLQSSQAQYVTLSLSLLDVLSSLKMRSQRCANFRWKKSKISILSLEREVIDVQTLK